MAEAAPNTAHPDPRRLSIRPPRPLWIGVATVALVIVAVWLRFGVPIYRQHLAIREIERLGGHVQTRPQAPEWMRRRFGDEWTKIFDEAVRVSLLRRHVSDADLANVKLLTSIRQLHINDASVTDAGLTNIAALTNLEGLSLGGTQITDEGLQHLNRMTKLQYLDLSTTRITGSGLRYLSGSESLKQLLLVGADVDDAGLGELSRIPSVSFIRLDNTHVTDAGLAHLERLPNLEQLYLTGTNITDAGLLSLRRLPRLAFVVMEGTGATEAGIADLLRVCPRLRRLIPIGGPINQAYRTISAADVDEKDAGQANDDTDPK